MKWIIGYSGCNQIMDYEVIEADSEHEASNEAYEAALNDLTSYGGLHGLPDENDYEDYEDFLQDAESWLDYCVLEYTQENCEEHDLEFEE